MFIQGDPEEISEAARFMPGIHCQTVIFGELGYTEMNWGELWRTADQTPSQLDPTCYVVQSYAIGCNMV